MRGLFPTIVCLLATFPLAAEDWTQFRGPDRDGKSSETGLLREWPAAGPEVLWSVELGPGYAGPAAFGDRVWVNDYDMRSFTWSVRCLSLESGKELWTYEERKRIRPNHLVTRTVPAVDGKHVFSLDPKCVFHALLAATGEELWQKKLVDAYGTKIPPWYAGQCPLIEDDRVLIAPGGDALVVALDKKTGAEIWRTPNPESWIMSHASLMPAELCGVKQYLYATLQGVQGISAATGELLWFFPTKLNLAVAVSPLAVGEDRVFMTNQYESDTVMIRLEKGPDGFSAREDYRFDSSKWNAEIHTPILFEDHLFAVGKKKRGLFTCLTPDGEIVWTSEGEASFDLGSFLLADGLFFALDGRSAELRLIEASTEEYRELARARLLEGDNVWAPMALSGGRLLIRDTKKMLCVRVGEPVVASRSEP